MNAANSEITLSAKDPYPEACGGIRGEPLAPSLSIVIPTFNEIDNIIPLVNRLHPTLAGIEWEAIFVDHDSRDQTIAMIRTVSLRDRRVRCKADHA